MNKITATKRDQYSMRVPAEDKHSTTSVRTDTYIPHYFLAAAVVLPQHDQNEGNGCTVRTPPLPIAGLASNLDVYAGVPLA